MLKTILNLEGVQVMNQKVLKHVNGGNKDLYQNKNYGCGCHNNTAPYPELCDHC
ncbi:hypothetical protein [Aquimarina aquimarini]|uniref:hypothetical protein n=1 Tax=Aquimarina aquimarini TaxID=1191734 RepID=UPI00131F24F2|nr:hypothetical protein [Aquimarina aquimarini]